MATRRRRTSTSPARASASTLISIAEWAANSTGYCGAIPNGAAMRRERQFTARERSFRGGAANRSIRPLPTVQIRSGDGPECANSARGYLATQSLPKHKGTVLHRKSADDRFVQQPDRTILETRRSRGMAILNTQRPYSAMTLGTPSSKSATKQPYHCMRMVALPPAPKTP